MCGRPHPYLAISRFRIEELTWQRKSSLDEDVLLVVLELELELELPELLLPDWLCTSLTSF